MILHWAPLVLHYGAGIGVHRSRFGEASQTTTQNDLVRLHDAGWELCVLQVGLTLSACRRLLLEGIERVAGRGIVRLHG